MQMKQPFKSTKANRFIISIIYNSEIENKFVQKLKAKNRKLVYSKHHEQSYVDKRIKVWFRVKVWYHQ